MGFKKTKVILGSINVSSSRVETVDEIRARLADALEYIDPERLIAAPDCGLALLDGEHRQKLNLKLANMCAAAKCVPCATRKRDGEDASGDSAKRLRSS